MPGRRRIPSNGFPIYPFDRQCTVGLHDQVTIRQVFNGHFAKGRPDKRPSPEILTALIGIALIGKALGKYAKGVSNF